nr:uncharacterized protein LOC107448430 [Parasteatoda tepidariorum]
MIIDISGNEIADSLAKAGATEATPPPVSLTSSELFSIAKAKNKSAWLTPPSHNWYQGTRPGSCLTADKDRQSQTAITRLRCGHLKSLRMAAIPDYFEGEINRMNEYNLYLKQQICDMEPKISHLRQPSEEICEQILDEFERSLSDLMNAGNTNLNVIQQELQRFTDIQGRLENEIGEIKNEAENVDPMIIELAEIRMELSIMSDDFRLARVNIHSPPPASPQTEETDRVIDLDQAPPPPAISIPREDPLPPPAIDLDRTVDLDEVAALDLRQPTSIIQIEDPLPPTDIDLDRVVDLDEMAVLDLRLPASSRQRVQPSSSPDMDLSRVIELDEAATLDLRLPASSLQRVDRLPPPALDLDRAIDLDEMATLELRPLASSSYRDDRLPLPAISLGRRVDLGDYSLPQQPAFSRIIAEDRMFHSLGYEGDESQDYSYESSGLDEYQLPPPTFDQSGRIEDLLRDIEVLNQEIDSRNEELARLRQPPPASYYHLGIDYLTDSSS